MKAVILAAGDGARMLPLTETRLKSLIPIAIKPIIVHILEALKTAGISEAVIVQKPDGTLKGALGTETAGVKLEYAVQKEPLGTANAVAAAKDFIKKDFLVLNGDDIIDAGTIQNLIEKGAPAVALAKVKDASAFGVAELDDDKVISFSEKSGADGFVNTGAFILPKKFFELKLEKSERGDYELPQAALQLGSLKYVDAIFWQPVGYPWQILEANQSLLNEIEGKNEAEVEQGATLKGKIIAGKGTIIRAGAYIEGPVLIGTNCRIGPNCYIRPYSTIGNNCKIGQSVEIKNSVIFNNTCLPHQNYVGDSIIGENCNIAAGTIIGNLRHDNANIKMEVNGEMVDTGLRKFGAVIGDNVKTGICSIIYPGRKIKSGATTKPGEVVEKNAG
ncbi:MAG: bifunctional sugar-1-phosphate nucleotidylyltransferase/acetyltransferase [archaeon]